MVKKLLLIFLLIPISISSQERRVLINGKILDSLGVVKNANIINLRTNQGSFSSDNGTFRMFVSIGDSLSISSVQHLSKKIFINKYNIDNSIVTLYLKLNVYQLDAFELKRHNLIGRLGIDTKSVPINKKDSLLNKLMDFSEINMKIIEGDDYIDKRVRPNLVETDPNMNFIGAGASVSMPFKYSEKLWALRRDFAYKKAFPYKILTDLGENFFFEKLKIPVDNYFHFLEYCNPLGIEKLYKEGKNLELIKILNHESNRYLKIIKKE